MKTETARRQGSLLLRPWALALGLILLGLAFVCLLSVPLASHAQSGTGAIHVTTTGSDEVGCGSAESPCRTEQYAVDQAMAGDEVLITTGIYTNPDMAAEGRLAVVDKTLG